MSSNDRNTGTNHDADRQERIDFTNWLVDTPLIVSKQRKCGLCGETGHNKRKCTRFQQEGEFHTSVEHQIKKID
jgi:hypothetical protein